MALKEIATVCGKNDGWQMIIEVHSEDHGILYDKTNPAHAHILDANGNYLGKFVITKEKPLSAEYVLDCDNEHTIPPEYKQKIPLWAKEQSPKYDEEDGLCTNWAAIKASWRFLHPEN